MRSDTDVGIFRVVLFCGRAKTGGAQSLVSDFDTPAYKIVSFRAGIEQENWQLTVFIDNMFDELIIYDYGGTMKLDLYDGAPFSTVGRPRTIGVSLRFNF